MWSANYLRDDLRHEAYITLQFWRQKDICYAVWNLVLQLQAICRITDDYYWLNRWQEQKLLEDCKSGFWSLVLVVFWSQWCCVIFFEMNRKLVKLVSIGKSALMESTIYVETRLEWSHLTFNVKYSQYEKISIVFINDQPMTSNS